MAQIKGNIIIIVYALNIDIFDLITMEPIKNISSSMGT